MESRLLIRNRDSKNKNSQNGTPSSQPSSPSSPTPAGVGTGQDAPPPDLPDITLTPTPIHRGPVSAVYRGWDRVNRRDVIAKVQRVTGDTVAAERFRREAAVMERLRHPHLVTLYQFIDGNPAALVMEYVPGRTLAQEVEADGWLAPVRTAGVIEDVAAALDSAHAVGVIHRDIKPSNILLPPHAPARLTDFGVAHIDDQSPEVPPLTVMGDILGTIEYASPEQVHGNASPDARSDVYSLAAVAYFALCGTPPFRAADTSTQAQLSVMHRQVFAAPPPLRFHREDLSPEVEQVVLRGLAKSPEARYPSAGQFAASLRAAVGSTPSDVVPAAVFVTQRRRGAIAGAIAVPVVVALAALGYWLTSGHSPSGRTHVVLPPNPQASRPVVPLPTPVKPVPPAVTAPPVPKPAPIVAAKPALKPASAPKIAAKPAPKAVTPPVRTASRPRRARPNPAPAKPNPVVAALPPQKRVKPLPPRRVAKAGVPPPRPSAPAHGWLRVVADRNILRLTMTSAGVRSVPVQPQSLWVDGKLAHSGWMALSPGRHTVSFVPKSGSGFAPKKDVLVTLRPGQYATTHIVLPPAPASAPRLAAAAPALPQKVGWYTVSGWVPASVPSRAAALWVKVDGVPQPALALGQWAQLSAGRHEVIFQPVAGQGVLPKTWQIDLAAQAHLDQKVPLPAAPPPEIPPHLRNPTTQ